MRLIGCSVSVGVAAINLAVETGDTDNLPMCLANPDANLQGVMPECTQTYYTKLAKFKERKASSSIGACFILNTTVIKQHSIKVMHFLICCPPLRHDVCVWRAGECGSGWMMNKLRDGYKFFFNVHTLEYSFERAESMKKDYNLLTRDEIQVSLLTRDEILVSLLTRDEIQVSADT